MFRFFGLIAIRFLLLRIAKCRVALSYLFSASSENSHPRSLTVRPWKLMVWKWNVLLWDGKFSGAMLNFRECIPSRCWIRSAIKIADVFKRSKSLVDNNGKVMIYVMGKKSQTSFYGSMINNGQCWWIKWKKSKVVVVIYLWPCVLWVDEFLIHDPSCNRCIPRF